LDFFFFADIEMKLGVIDYNNDQVWVSSLLSNIWQSYEPWT
jgi:hypothetical protein